MTNWRTFYSSPGNAFGIRGPFYGSVGHRGDDWKAKAGAAVPAYEGGVVVLVQFSKYLGTVVVVRMFDGMYAGYCHLKPALAKGIAYGARVATGQSLGYVAGAGDTPGASWAGPHLHTTLSRLRLGVFEGVTFDPRPRIRHALATVTPAKAGVVKIIKAAIAKRASYSLGHPGRARVKRVQRGLKARGRYAGGIHGVFNRATARGVQITLRGVGYDGIIDGKIERNGALRMQVYAAKFGSYKGDVDGYLAGASWDGFALGLERA